MFSPGRFDRLLSAGGGLGQHLAWSRATLCPCRSPVSGQAKPGCPQCGGRGVMWDAALAAWAGMASMRSAREWAAFGQFETGDVVLTVPNDSPFYACGEFDRAVMVNSSEPFNTVLLSASVKLNFQVISIDDVAWLNGSALVRGAIPVQLADRTLSWAPGAGPPAGVQFTVRGRRRPEYYVFKDYPQDRAHAGGLPLPRRIVLRKWDLFGK